MAAPSRQTVTRTAPSDGDDNYLHIVSFTQWVLDKVLRVKVPRALCGVLLVADLDKPDPLESNAPTCPRCKALNR
jgi:hypothetical protein